MISNEELIKRFADYVYYFHAYCTSDAEDHEMLKAVLTMLKEQADQIEQLEHDLAVTQNNLNYYVNGND